MAKILVVEDDKDISTLITFHLKANGFETDTAVNGREAVEKLAREKYELALLDILLPELSGIEVLKYIRTVSPNPELPVIVASALTEESEIITSLELGADDYITKPFSPKEMVLRVNNIMKHTSMALALQEKSGRLRLKRILQLMDSCFWEHAEIPQTGNRFNELLRKWMGKEKGKFLQESKIVLTEHGKRGNTLLSRPQLCVSFQNELFSIKFPREILPDP